MIGKRLQEFRKTLGITQKEFAKLFGVSEITIRRYELGKTKLDVDFILQLKERFNLNPNWLLTGEGEMFIKPKERNDIEKQILQVISGESEEKKKALLEFLKSAWVSQTQSKSENSSKKILTND